MDPTTLIPLISPLVAAAVAYLKGEGAKTAGEKAVEVLGEKAGEAVAGAGPRVLTTLRTWFQKKGASEAQEALDQVAREPDDDAAQQQLVTETARLAVVEPTFAQELRILAAQVTVVQPGGVAIDNQAPNYGAQGTFNAPVTFDQRKS